MSKFIVGDRVSLFDDNKNLGFVVAYSPEERLYLVQWGREFHGVTTANKEQGLIKVENKKRFGELTLEEKVMLFTAWCIDNDSIVASSNNRVWYPCLKPDWAYDCYYKVAETLPSIDWSQVSNEYNYLILDVSGSAWLTSHKPELIYDTLLWKIPGQYTRAEVFKSFKKGTIHYTKSLVQRPKGA